MADKLKNLLLAVLLLLMAGLLALTFFVSIQGSRGGQRLLQTMDEGESLVIPNVSGASAQPEVLAVLQPNGVFLADDGQSYDVLYRQMEPLWQEALGSAMALEAVDSGDYRALLQAPGILLQYHTAQPMYLLRAWSGSELTAEEMEVSGIALVGMQEQVLLLVTDLQGGRWKAQTSASYGELNSLCASVGSTNARLAGEHPILSADQVLTEKTGSFDTVRISAPDIAQRGELSQNLLSLFGMNAYLTKVYLTADDSLVYVEGHSTVSLSPGGDLAYSGTGIDLELSGGTELETRAEICRKVYDRLLRLWQQAGASGVLCLEAQEWNTGGCVLRFGLQLEGVVLEKSRGDWATVTVENGRITGMTISPRLLTAEDSVQLLPGRQAETVLPQGRARLRVRLLEQKDGTMLPQRCRVTEG